MLEKYHFYLDISFSKIRLIFNPVKSKFKDQMLLRIPLASQVGHLSSFRPPLKKPSSLGACSEAPEKQQR